MSSKSSLQEYLTYIACPDCAGEISVMGTEESQAAVCTGCQIVFPVVEDIPVMLDKDSRHPKLEIPLVETLLDIATTDIERDACNNTLDWISNHDFGESYAWEDEVHWSEVYQQQLAKGEDKNWNDRWWQRTPLFSMVTDFLQESAGNGERIVVDMGCGEGQDFRVFLADKLGHDDLYIGLDISLPGLLLNRANNPHERALYILGSADKSPLKRNIADVIISLGTLHHMESKEYGLAILNRLLNKGMMVLSDPINGQFLPSYLRFGRGARSAHDDSIDLVKLKQLVRDENLDIQYERQLSGIFYILMMKFLRPALLNSRTLHSLTHSIDDFFNYTFGKVFSIFRPRGLLLVLKSG